MCSDRHLTSRASGSGGDGLPICGAQRERTMPGPMFKPIKNFKAATVEPETKCTFHPHDGRGAPERSQGHGPGVWPMRPALEADGAGYGAFVVCLNPTLREDICPWLPSQPEGGQWAPCPLKRCGDPWSQPRGGGGCV